MPVALKKDANMAMKPKLEESNPRLKAAFSEVIDN